MDIQIKITRTQANKAMLALLERYRGENDPDVAELLATLIRVIDSSPQRGNCICGASLSTDATGQIAEYCSESCRQQAYRERNRARRRKAVEQQVHTTRGH